MSIRLRERTGAVRKKGEFAGRKVTVWYLDYNINGKRWTETLPIKYVKGHRTFGNKKEQLEKADAIRAQKENEILNMGYDYTPKSISKINFCDYFENFISGYKKGDKRMFQASFKMFIEYLEDSETYDRKLLSIVNVDYEVCKRFADHLKNSHLTGETPYNYFEKFKHVLNTLVKKQFIRVNPISQFTKSDKIVREKNDDLSKEILYLKELKVLSETKCPNDEVKDAFLFACFTGLGLAEIKKLTWDNLKDDKLNIRRAKTGTKVDFRLSKSALKILTRYKERKGMIFNLPSSTNGVNKSLHKWIMKAKIDKHITFYCARHSFAVMLLEEAGANLKVVADCMGHTTTVHTVRYLKYIGKSKDKAMNALPSL